MLQKLRVVHYINQFFAGIGGEEYADVGFALHEKPVGPGVALQRELGERGEVVATLVCGDNFFAGDFEKNAEEGFRMIEQFKPDLFIAGPAFAAGRYGPSCGAMCKIVSERLGIPAITAMNEENPGVEMYSQYAYIVKCGVNSKEMTSVIKKMVRLADALLENKPDPRLVAPNDCIPSPFEYDYYTRNLIKNVFTEETTAERSIDLLLKKIRKEPFESDVLKPPFGRVKPGEPIKDITKAKIAFVTDGGIVPAGNPDRIPSRMCTIWKEYELDKLCPQGGGKHEVSHRGYNNYEVLMDYNRLMPIDPAREFEKEGRIGKLNPTLFTTCGNVSIVKKSKIMGDEIAKVLVDEHVDAVILTSA